MSRTFRFKKKHQAVGRYRYSHFADIRDNQPAIDDFTVARCRAVYYKEGVYSIISDYFELSSRDDRYSIFRVLGYFTTRSRHSSHKNPHYTSHWDDQVKGCWRDRANDADIRFDRRKKMKKMMGRQLLASR